MGGTLLRKRVLLSLSLPPCELPPTMGRKQMKAIGMARMRIIKPSFFINEELAEFSHQTRLYFIGLWCLCDRDGKMEYRPMPIRAQIFPYESADIEQMTQCLHRAGMVQVYDVDGVKYLKVVNFLKHQNPHIKENSKGYPEPSASTVLAPYQHHTSPVGTGDLIMDNGDLGNVQQAAPQQTKAKRSANPSISLSQFLGNTTQTPAGWLEREPARKLLDASSQWERFRDHFLGNGKRWQRWELAWDNWCRRNAEWQGSSTSNGYGQARGGGNKPDIVAAASRRTLVELFGDSATELDGQGTSQGAADACPFGDRETAIEAVFVVEPTNLQACVGTTASPFGGGENSNAGAAFQDAVK